MSKTTKPHPMRDPHTAPVWWGIPKRFSGVTAQRKISWLELFYDLVYAGAVAQLTDYLAHHTGMQALAYVAFLFAFLYWAWLNGSFYHDLHGTPGVRSRLTTLWQMMSMAAVAVTLPGVFEGHYTGFAVSFGILQAIITYLWWSTGWYDPQHIALNRWYVFNYSIGFVLIAVSIFTPPYVTRILWVAVLILDHSAPVLSRRSIQSTLSQRRQSFDLSDSMIERFGLFTMIVIGESLLGIIHGVGDCRDASATTWRCFVLSLLIVFLLWWVYYDLLGESHARPGFASYIYLSWGYFPLLFAFAVIGSTLRSMLADTVGATHSVARALMGFSIAIILFATVFISSGMKQDEAETRAVRMILWLVLISSAIIATITVLGHYVSLTAFLALIAITLLAAIAFAFRIWLGYGLFGADE